MSDQNKDKASDSPRRRHTVILPAFEEFIATLPRNLQIEYWRQVKAEEAARKHPVKGWLRAQFKAIGKRAVNLAAKIHTPFTRKP